MRLRIEGHTDAVPFNAPGGNLQLSRSRRRRPAVPRRSRHHRRPPQQQGYGDRCPVATNQSPEGRQANRRTEFSIIDLKTGEGPAHPCVTYTPPPKPPTPAAPSPKVIPPAVYILPPKEANKAGAAAGSSFSTPRRKVESASAGAPAVQPSSRRGHPQLNM